MEEATKAGEAKGTESREELAVGSASRELGSGALCSPATQLSILDTACIQPTALKPAGKALAASTKALLTAYSSPSCAPSRDTAWLQGCTKGSDMGQYSYSGGIQCFYDKASPEPTPVAHRSKPRVLSTCSCLSSLQHLSAHPAKPKQPHGSSAPAPHLDVRLCNLSALPAGFYV